MDRISSAWLGETACVISALRQLPALGLLLGDGGARAKEIIGNYRPVFENKEACFAYVDGLNMEKETVCYREDGSVVLTYRN